MGEGFARVRLPLDGSGGRGGSGDWLALPHLSSITSDALCYSEAANKKYGVTDGSMHHNPRITLLAVLQ